MLADAFIKGAEAAGHSVVKFESARKKISGCIACQKCYTKEGACVFNDDFNELAPLIEGADMLVLATPLYWFSFPAQIKAALDKMYSLMVGEREINVRESVLLAAAETGNMADFDGMTRTFERLNDYMEWKEAGRILVPHVNEVGDILKTDALTRAEQLGKNV